MVGAGRLASTIHLKTIATFRGAKVYYFTPDNSFQRKIARDVGTAHGILLQQSRTLRLR
jgi:hypothetical protein